MNKNTENGSKALYGLGADPAKGIASSFDAAGYNNMLRTLNSNAAGASQPPESLYGGIEAKFPAKENVPKKDFAFYPQMKESQPMLGNTNANLLKTELNKLFPSGLPSETSPDLNFEAEFHSDPNSFITTGYSAPPSSGLAQSIWAPHGVQSSTMPTYGNFQFSADDTHTTAPEFVPSSIPINRESIPNVTATASPSSLDVSQTIAALAAHAATAYSGKPVPTLDSLLTTGVRRTSGVSARPAFSDPSGYNVPLAPPPTPNGSLPTPLSAHAPHAPYSHAFSDFSESPVDPTFVYTTRRSARPPGLHIYSHNAPLHSPGLASSMHSYHGSSLTTPVTPFTPLFSPTSVPSPTYGGGSYGYASDWDHVVEQILVKCDQQCSMNMQNKIKVADPYEMERIADAVLGRSFQLMTNRTGNFLVQRLLEHSPPDMIVRLANSILGHVVELSMDQYACHVIQKAFESVPEHYKLLYIKELLTEISKTMNNKHAAHVWQKLFELRWKNPAPKIMPFVNRDLKGQWPRIANGETGSLVVQNVFENCVEDDKRPCVNEIIENLEEVAKGQFGNWCVQHIIEHGMAEDQDYIVNYILDHATDWSMDQYASKCVEKALKCGDDCKFVERYLDKVCEPEPGRSRVPLIDISGDQYGNYLIQWIICNHTQESKDRIANHVRKHMVSLRGSKFGSRVAIACTNYHSQTRPGPATGISPLRSVGFGRHGSGEGPAGGSFSQNQ